MIKLIASDMDGTLIGANGKISKENLAAIKMAQEKGVKFAIATGRTYENVKPLLDECGLSCECITMNGGEYKDIEGKTVEGIYINKSMIAVILNILSKYNVSIEIYTHNGHYTTNTKEEILRSMTNRVKTYYPEFKSSDEIYKYVISNYNFLKINYITNLDDFLQSNLYIGKIVSFAESISEINELKDELKKLDNLAISSCCATNVEINDVSATKGRILAKVTKKMGIRKEEVAILGDSSNDYSMFVEFPNSFAMENAAPEIRKAAKYITASNLDHGVAKAIYQILDIK